MEQIGKYKVLAHIGHGAMGSVEKAEAPDGTIVAIKTLFPQFVYEEEYVKRFKREAELAKKLSHPNVVKIIEVGEDNEGRRQYIVMEYIDGRTLAEYMHDKGMASVAIKRSSKLNEEKETAENDKKVPKTHPKITTFSAKETIKIIRQLAGVLQAANDIGLLHRDVKPQNILLDKKGNAKLLDFGLAKDTEALVSMLSMTGQSIGTPPYMSPEQHDGQKDIDIRSDLYSLGCTAYHMLTSKAPFPGPTASAFARQHCDDIPEPVHNINPDCPLNLSQLIDRLLAKKPANRHHNPSELIEDLNRVERGEVPLKLYKPKKSKKHNPVRNWLTVAAAVIIVAACFLGWDSYRRNNAKTIIAESLSDARELAVEYKFKQAKNVLDDIISEYAETNPEQVKQAEALRTKLIEQHGKWIASEAARGRQEQGVKLTRAEAVRKRKLHNCLRNAMRLKNSENHVRKAVIIIEKAYLLSNTDAERTRVAIIEKQVKEALLKMRPWAAVADFTLDKSVEAKLTGSAVAVKLEQALGQKYRLVTRSQVKKALRELRFQSSDLADNSKAKQFGKLVGAEYLISGSVIQLGREITVACQIFNIETGAIRQTAEVSTSNINDFNYMIRDAAKILAMSNADKIKYVKKLNSPKRIPKAKYPQTSKDIKIPLDNFNAVPNAEYAALSGLSSGSQTAQKRQKKWVKKLALPLEIKTKKIGIKLRLIPPGTFTMGSPLKEDKRGNDEKQRQVTLSEAFYCGKFEITQGQWKRVMSINPSRFVSSGDNAPVEQVSWDDCQKFLNRLCSLEGVPSGTYRLLTEAEWEYACRAGTSTTFYYGNSLSSNMANSNGDAPYNATKGINRKKTIPVGNFKANAWGLYDMHGNVWEWCSNHWTGSTRVFRGGSWYSGAFESRSACRYEDNLSKRFFNVGLRIAFSPHLDNNKIIPGLGMKLVYVAPGSFMMGSNNGESNETPVHKVTISSPYWIGKYEVNQREYKSLMKTNPSSFDSDNKPVNKVNWFMAVEFCKKINEQELKAGRLPSGYEYRLPTEAEWEFAARGGNKSKGFIYSGSNDKKQLVCEQKGWSDIGTKVPNELGIYDMSGNIWEWCNDWYEIYKNNSQIDPTGNSTGSKRIIRGGSWRNDASYCRVARHYSSSPKVRGSGLGFRIVLGPIIVDGKIKTPAAPAVKIASPVAEANPLDKTIPELGLKLVHVEPGTFLMGSNDEASSMPLRKVKIDKAYWIGKYEITQQEYQAIMGSNPSRYKRERRPVETVTWNDAIKFCEKLTKQEEKAKRLPVGYEFRLPTEAEWEYAARGGNKSHGYKYSGSNDVRAVAWNKHTAKKRPHEVGGKAGNELGIHDMSGNLYEWCLDNWHENYNKAPINAAPWLDPFNPARIYRGGGFLSPSKWSKVSHRSQRPPDQKTYRLGFRVVLAPVVKTIYAKIPDKIIPDLGMTLVYVMPGSFDMGSNSKSSEKPVHEVTIHKGYWIGKYEVTQNEYQKIMGTNPSQFKGENKPVEKVTWSNAVNFCKELTKRERKAGRLPSAYTYQLPTEAEWEFVARGGNKSKGYKYSGGRSLSKVAWTNKNSEKQTHEVGKKAANELGIHDMSGNVYEWCLDDWHANYTNAPSAAKRWGKGNTPLRVRRGGSWRRNFVHKTTSRSSCPPTRKYNYLGFRIVLSTYQEKSIKTSTASISNLPDIKNTSAKTILPEIKISPPGNIKSKNTYRQLSDEEHQKNIKSEKKKARKRMYADMKKYSKKQYDEIQSLYQALYKLKDPQKTETLKELIRRYPNANRSGCAALSLAYYQKGNAQQSALLKVIRKYSDCYYGDGTNVGADAKYFLARFYLSSKKMKKLELIFKDLQRNHPAAIHHNRKNIVSLVEEML